MNDAPSPLQRPATVPQEPPQPSLYAMAEPGPTDQVRRAFSALRRRWLPALAVFLFVLAGAVYYNLRQPLAYTATANLVVNARVLDIVSPETGVVPKAPPGDAAVNTEVQILQSHEVAQRVADALAAGPVPGFAERITGQPAPRSREIVANVLQGKLAIRRPGETNVLGVSFTATDPVLAAMVANMFARQYIVVKTSTRLSAARSADTDLGRQLENMRGQVERAEAAVAQYKASNNLLSAEGSTLTEQEVSLYKQQQAAASTTLAEDRARLSTARQQMRAGSKGDDVGEALGSPVIGALRQQRAQISNRVAELRARYQPGYPALEKARDQLADTDQAIQAEIGRVVSNLEARVSVSAQRAATADAILGGARGQLTSNNAASVRLAELQRRADAVRSTYAAMLARRNAVTSEAMVGTGDARLFSPATVPQNPSSPNRKLNLAIGAMLAALLAGLTVWLLQAFDRGIVTSHDAEKLLGLPHLANVPLVRSIATRSERGIAPADFVLERPLSMIAEATRNILLSLEQTREPGIANVIGVTSSRPEEGKTTLAIGLARMSASGGRRTLLIDGDVRRGSVCPTLNLTPTAGLIEVMEGTATVEEAIIHDERSGCWILPSLVQAYTPSQFGATERLSELIGQLGETFDTVIVDTPPVLAAAESRMILLHVDAVVFAVRWKSTLLPVIRAALKRLRDVGIVPIGTVLTMADMRAIARYGSDDVDHTYKAYQNYGYG